MTVENRRLLLSLLNDGAGDPPSTVRRSSESPQNLFSHPELAPRHSYESADEHKRFALAVGYVSAQLRDSLLSPIYRRHKELVPDGLKGELL